MNSSKRYFKDLGPRHGSSKSPARDIHWHAYECIENGQVVKIDHPIFRHHSLIYQMPYRATAADVAKINQNPTILISSHPLPPERRPSLDTNSGNVHLQTAPTKDYQPEPQLIFVEPRGNPKSRTAPTKNNVHYGVGWHHAETRDKFPDINFIEYTDQNGEKYYVPSACYYPPISKEKFKTAEELQIQAILKACYENLNLKENP